MVENLCLIKDTTNGHTEVVKVQIELDGVFFNIITFFVVLYLTK